MVEHVLKQRKCPNCGKRFSYRTVSSTPDYPFCSERCKTLDLGAWLSEEYRILEEAPQHPQSLDDMADDQYWA